MLAILAPMIPQTRESNRSRQWRRALFAILCAGLLACSKQDAPPISAVLITLDTTNVRALDVYGPDRGITPNLTEFAEGCVIFDRAHTVAPITLPAHSSMMTGLYPLRHGVRDNGLMQLPSEANTLAEIALDAGYQTAAFVAARVLSSPFGIAQGFETFDEPDHDRSPRVVKHIAERPAPEVTDRALEWIARRDPDRPFFLWVHYFDPHDPYDPPEQFLEQAEGREYFGEIAAMDHEVGRLLDALEREVGFDQIFFGVVADHGESLYRHGEPTHTALIYEDTMHVPFLLRFPGGQRAGQRSEEIVSVVDVFPTFLEQLGLDSPAGIDGLSLAGSTIPPDRGVYMESYTGALNFGWSPLVGWVDDEGKYLHSSKPELYDLKTDPKEEKNLYGVGPLDPAPYVDAIARLSALPRLSSGGPLNLSTERMRELRSLGYAAAGDPTGEIPDPLDPSDLPAPGERIEAFSLFTSALTLAYSGERQEEALKVMEDIIRENPNNLYAKETLGGVLIEARRFNEAQVLFEELLTRGGERFVPRASLGWLHARAGRLKEAETNYERALELRPEESALAAQLAKVQKRMADQ